MTKKEFKDFMRRGLGRCVWELENAEDAEKYREIVLWGCMHDLSYDTQCEGTRAWYLRELIRQFPDEKPFIDTVIQKLSGCNAGAGWALSQYCELLALFAREGDQQAFSALWRKYEELYEVLAHKKKRRKNGNFPEGDNFETLCIELIDSAEHPLEVYLKIAEDIGVLLVESSVLGAGTFDYLSDHCEQTYGEKRVRKMLAKRAKSSPAVDRYIYHLSVCHEEIIEKREQYRQSVPQTTEDMLKAFDEAQKREQESGGLVRFSELRIRAWVKKTGNKEVLTVLAQRYLAEQDAGKRAGLLRVFGRYCPFPLSPEPLIKDAESGDEMLEDAAFNALSYVHHEKVRQFALKLAAEGKRISDAVILLANHYRKNDREMFVRLVKSIPVTYDDKSGWHGAYLSVSHLIEAKGVRDAPKELLPYMYEHTLCSCCREYIVKEMGRRRMMTRELLRECLYDSNDEIRNYARRKHKS